MSHPVNKTSWNLRTGDVLLMDRRCMSMRDPLSISICLLNKTECQYDHVAMIVELSKEEVQQQQQRGIIDSTDVVSPSGTYVLEMNLKGITLRSLENRLAKSSANKISTRLLHMREDTRAEFNRRLLGVLETLRECPYKKDVQGFLPSFLSPPDKMDRVKAAHKLQLLAMEIVCIDEILSSRYSTEKKSGVSEGEATALRRLLQIYLDASAFLNETYFPHLEPLVGGAFPTPNWTKRHFGVDGSNTDTALFCSELIIRLWQGCGMVTGFPPASSYRPFDFLDDSRFNFFDPVTSLSGAIPLKSKGVAVVPTRECTAVGDPPAISERLNFYSHVSGGASLDDGIDSMYRWLVQSNTSREVYCDLAFNLVSIGVLFALCGLISAPLRLRWTECQVGVILVRGSVWSLSAGIFSRDMLCAATQGLATCLALRWLPQSDLSYGLLGPPLLDTSWFDSRHPYYYVCVVYLMANAVAHVVTTPVLNATLAYHFGPVTPGPLPWRTLMRGAVSLWPLGVILPYQAVWVTWYETLGSAIIPTPSSLLRRRTDLLNSEEWRHFRLKALTGAFAATAAIDLICYPLQTRCWRSFLAELYRPASSPCYGRQLYAGYGFRFAGNMLTMATTSVSLYLLGVC